MGIFALACMDVFHQVSLARSAPMRGDGQGEGLLFTSYDRTLIVKQISSEEVADMHNILSEYHQVSHNILLSQAISKVIFNLTDH